MEPNERGSGASAGADLRVVIAGGGTGGHLFPGIAVAREIARRVPAAGITFAGTARGLEARVVPREGFALDCIRSAGLKRTSPAARLRGFALLPLSGLDAWRLLSRRRPHLVIGVGGYSSGPVVLAAALRRIPTLLLEQNAVPGLTNRLLARVVDAAALTYERSLPWFGRRGFVAGNPVRAGFLAPAGSREAADADEGRRAWRLLVFGGSQGAHAINLAMMAAAGELAALGDRLVLTHQTGARDLELVAEAYRAAGLEARTTPFLDAMDEEVRRADLVVCRAGATTIAEVTAAGRPVILVPLATAADDHQRRNAEELVRSGAAEMIEERGLHGTSLAERIRRLLEDGDRRRAMGAAARRLARPDAAAVIADRALALAGVAPQDPATGG